MKALWKGYVAIGRLGIPVRLYAATRPSGVRFVQLHETDGSPVERPLFCLAEHVEIPSDQVVRGVETEPGTYVTFTDQELERVQGTSERTIEIRQFCMPDQIPLAYYEKPYYLVAAPSGEHGYALLREALGRKQMVAVGRFTFYANEYVGVIVPYEDVLLLQRLRFSDELVPRADVSTPALPPVDPRELDMMQAVMDRHGGALHLRDYHDAHAEYLRALCERKSKGLPMRRRETLAADATPAADIPDVLRSLMRQDASFASLSTGAPG